MPSTMLLPSTATAVTPAVAPTEVFRKPRRLTWRCSIRSRMDSLPEALATVSWGFSLPSGWSALLMGTPKRINDGYARVHKLPGETDSGRAGLDGRCSVPAARSDTRVALLQICWCRSTSEQLCQLELGRGTTFGVAIGRRGEIVPVLPWTEVVLTYGLPTASRHASGIAGATSSDEGCRDSRASGTLDA